MSGRPRAVPGGNSQGPLNFLQRGITRSTKLSRTSRYHIRGMIRRAKSGDLADIQQAAEDAIWIRAYSEIARLSEKLDTLDVMDKAYKPTIWSIAKLTEIISKFRQRKRKAPPKTAAALWQPKPSHVHADDDGETT